MEKENWKEVFTSLMEVLAGEDIEVTWESQCGTLSIKATCLTSEGIKNVIEVVKKYNYIVSFEGNIEIFEEVEEK